MAVKVLYVCMYVYTMYVYEDVDWSKHSCKEVHGKACLCVEEHKEVQTSKVMYTYMHTCIHINIHTYIKTHVYIHIYIHQQKVAGKVRPYAEEHEEVQDLRSYVHIHVYMYT